MGRAKDIIVRVIPSDVARAFVRRYHYSGKVNTKSHLHFGVFLDDRLHGVASFGQGIDKRKTIGLVKDTGWNEFLELDRLAFDDYLPKNSESRALAIIFKLLKKNAPHVKWILSYADGSQCGDGSIYRAVGFKLTQIKANTSMYRLPDGEVVCKLVFESSFGSNGGNSQKVKYGKTGVMASWTSAKFLNHIGATLIPGFQLRYIYLLDKNCELTVPVLDYDAIDRAGAGMYKGERTTRSSRRETTSAESVTVARPASSGEEGFDSTSALQSFKNEK